MKNTAVDELISTWFPKSHSEHIRLTISSLPALTLSLVERLANGDGLMHFESITPQRTAFSLLRVLSRIFCSFSIPIVIRAELELTHRCNFACNYCHTRLAPDAQEKALGVSDWLKVIDDHSKIGCRYLHINGGEISLIPFVPQLVRRAKVYGMRVGVSSNGSGDLEFYRDLIEAGLDYAHISFDTADHDQFDGMCSTRGAWERVTRSLAWLSKEGRLINSELFVVANLVLTEKNILTLPSTVQYLKDIGVDDIKLLPTAELIEQEVRFGAIFRTHIVPDVNELLGTQQDFGLLRMRLSRLFNGLIHGIELAEKQNNCLVACEVALEQTMIRKDGVYAPCYIYMREQYKVAGYGLGTASDSSEIRSDRAHNRLEKCYTKDLTCQTYCPDIIRRTNSVVQDGVISCLINLLQSAKSKVILNVGEIAFSYTDLEAPYHLMESSSENGSIFCIPGAYPVTSDEIFHATQCFVAQINNREGEDALWNIGLDPVQTVCNRIAGKYLRTTGQYIAFRMLPMEINSLRAIEEYLEQRFLPKHIKAHLMRADSIVQSWNIKLPVIIRSYTMR